MRLISKTFVFNKSCEDNELIFIDHMKILRFNYLNRTEIVQYRFDNCLSEQPELMVFDDTQTMAIVASVDDALWVSIKDQEEVDIDEFYHIAGIQAIHFCKDDQKFYLLANKLNRKLGYYLL